MTRYGSLSRFKDTFCPQVMPTVAKDPGRAYYGTAPTLDEVRLAFGGDADITWLCMMLDHFVEYCGKGYLSGTQIMGVAQRLSSHQRLRVTEFMLFFWRLGNAEYGRVYGTIDPLFITDGFNKFLKQRENERGEYAVTTTDDISEYDNLPKMRPKEFWQMAMDGKLDHDVAEQTLKLLGPY